MKLTDTPERHEGYEERLAKERDTFESVQEVHDLPPIFHYWSNKHIRPMVKEYGFCLAEEFFAKYCAIAAKRTNHPPVFLSLGAGNCDTEVRTAQLLRNVGLTDFVIECLELNPQMIERGKDLAAQSGVNANIVFVQDDFNRWKPNKQYAAIFAYQSLHHVLELEHLFAEVKRGLHPAGFFVTSDMIGRNGHQRWPEAMDALKPFWNELPFEYRRNRSLKRYEEEYVNHDCSTEGFEGIRAQDILPLLLRNFDFHMFIAFGNIIDVFVDRSFGPNFEVDGEWDRAFIDRVHLFDEQAILDGVLTPTHMFAVMTPVPCKEHHYARGLAPERCIRREPLAVQAERLGIVTSVLQPQQPGGTSYSVAMAAAGGTPPYAWFASDLPPGLTLSPEGVLSGWIEEDGAFTPLITAKDSSRPPKAVAQRYTLLNKPREQALPLTLIPPTYPYTGIVGARFMEAIPAAGGTPPVTWSLIEGSLPRGLQLDRVRGVIWGEPVDTSSATLTIRACDSADQSATTQLTVRIESPDSGLVRVGVFPHMPCGGGWSTSLHLVNPTSAQLSLAVKIHSSGGRRVNWSLRAVPDQGQFHGSDQCTLAPHASLFVIVDSGMKEEVRGWAEVFSTYPVVGHAVLNYTTAGGVRSEVTTPLETEAKWKLQVPFDNEGGNRTGIALLDMSATRQDALVATIWDERGEFISAPTIPLAGGRHTAFMLAERFPSTAHRRGILDLHATSGGSIHVISLRVTPDGVFMLLPPIRTSMTGGERSDSGGV